ncbi:MAG: N-acetyltransferase family protein [Allosphingosinicella sp.]
MDAISFREAKSSDAPALGRVHVTSWRESYAGLLPDHLLDGLSTEGRSAMWSAILNDPTTSGRMSVFVAESEGEIVGFGACGSQREEALAREGFDGEVGAIYVLRSHQRAGVGNKLMGLMCRRLLDQGRSAAALWVLRENLSARTFYEGLGGAVVGERSDEESGAMLFEVAYGWSDLSVLAR